MTNITVEERRKWIGGSEIAALFGLSPYTTLYELFHQKSGTIEAPDLDNERVAAGNFMEPAIAAWAQDKFGFHIRRVRRYMPHPDVEGFGTSLDYETVTGHYPVEIKNVDSFEFKEKWQAEGDTIIEAPMHIALQLQCQIACANKEKGYLLACVGGNRLLKMEVSRHEEAIEQMALKVAQFWQDVDKGNEPEPDFSRDHDAIAQVYRMAGDEVVDLTGSNRFTSLVHDYAQAAEDEKAAKQRKQEAKAEMLAQMGDAAKAIVPGFSISATTVAGRTMPAYERKPYRNFRVTAVKKKEMAA
jgi:putative phage-type endonuclease